MYLAKRAHCYNNLKRFFWFGNEVGSEESVESNEQLRWTGEIGRRKRVRVGLNVSARET